MAKKRTTSSTVKLPRRTTSSGAYYSTHRRNTLREFPISMGRFENGTIIRMDYFGKTTNRYKTAFYLIINATHDNYTHVFDIDFIPASVLNYIVTLTKNKKLEDFFFANTTVSYYNFSSYDRSLYKRLLPIMQNAYRKLIRNSKYIRRTYLIDYNFQKTRSAIKPKFVYPSISDEIIAIEKVADELNLDLSMVLEAANLGKLVTLTPTIWSNIQNTTSWEIGLTQQDVRLIAASRGKNIDTTNRIISGMKSSQTFYAPIILKYNNAFYCVAGNTRLMAAMALRVTPKVYIFTYND